MLFLQLRWPVALLAVFALTVAGCGGGGPKLATVTGKVTLDGQPAQRLLVAFEPAEGRPSQGKTDTQGMYELFYTFDKKGAAVGKHTVRIVGASEDEEGNEIENPVRIPPKYNEQSELTADVESGSNEIDFDLQSN